MDIIEVRCTWCQKVMGTIVGENDGSLDDATKAHLLVCTEHPFNKIQPCGHQGRYVFPPNGDKGTTHYCILCQQDDLSHRMAATRIEARKVRRVFGQEINALKEEVARLKLALAEEGKV